jgi:uncharacterized protein YdiU (UPF0061 family)
LRKFFLMSTLETLGSRTRYSLLDQLTPDPEQAKYAPNKKSRQVFSGHYVEVLPTPLPNPVYVAHSHDMAARLGISDEVARSDRFVRFFSGDMDAVKGIPGFHPTGWATSYALSIYGQEMYDNCPFRTGNGYGDGRAISICEAVVDGVGWEMQLKGSGTTPWCRGGDGRAVLRSSIREFLASEAMHHMGVPTTRGLILVQSGTETVERQWYMSDGRPKTGDEPTAIATRVAASFLRVGQLELFGRRTQKNEYPHAKSELQKIVTHAMFREYPYILEDPSLESMPDKVLAFAVQFRQRLADLVANWVRVAFCQGNFNSDNCAIGGRTLDYGPFGFMERYNPRYSPWVGGGAHFAFMNQHNAAARNFRSFCVAIAPLIIDTPSALEKLEHILGGFVEVALKAIQSMFSKKLGLLAWYPDVFEGLENLMSNTPVDYTIFWRELSRLPESVTQLRISFYDVKTEVKRDVVEKEWNTWLVLWHKRLSEEGRNKEEISQGMLQVNPKFIPREWMLVSAYEAATGRNDFSLIHELQQVFADPYGEQSVEMTAKYYRKATVEALEKPGTAFMTCSS